MDDGIAQGMGSPAFRQDPYPLYGRMRREQPLYRSPQGICYLTRYADVEAALRDLRLSNDRDRITRALAAQGGARGLSRLTQGLGRVMTNTDPPDHARLRKLVNKAFSAGRVRAFGPRVQALADGLLDAAQAAGSGLDLIAAFAYPLTLTVICELLGVPHGEQGRVIAWIRQMEKGAGGGVAPEAVEQAVGELNDYLGELIDRRRAEPADDLISALLEAQDNGDRLDGEELLSACFVLLGSGYETTMGLIGNAMLALLRHPEQLRLLRDQPGLIRPAIEEVLRYDSPNQMVIRVVAQPVEFAGQTLEEGEFVHLVQAAANRDPERFADPDRFDLLRPDKRHLSFGNGVHFCLGAPLSRLEAGIAVGTLLRRFPALRLDTETLEWRPNRALRGLVSLPVAY